MWTATRCVLARGSERRPSRPPTPRAPLRALAAQVQAHGGQLLQEGGTFFWVGTSRKVGAAAATSDAGGRRLPGGRTAPPTAGRLARLPPKGRRFPAQVPPWWISYAINMYESQDLVTWRLRWAVVGALALGGRRPS